MFGREVRLPIDLQFGLGATDTVSTNAYAQSLQESQNYAYELVRELLGEAQNRQKTLYDQCVHGKPLEQNDKVWLHSSVVPPGVYRKFHKPWTGPYEVIEKLSDLNYKIYIRETHNCPL